MITSWTGTDLATITKGAWDKAPPQAPVNQIEIDHRHLDQTGLFIALAGAHHDGHDFLSELSANHCALVTTPCPTSKAHQLAVSDALDALHAIAKAAMSETNARKIAITGSVGKTSTKDALASLLQVFGVCHASRGNYNNHIGAPLSMARTPDDAEMIVMEMGMNHQGEISPLSHLFDADIAIITKIADSHIGHFDSLEDIAHAKAEIFDGMTSGTAILPFDDTHYNLLHKAAIKRGLRSISFGANDGADFQNINQKPLTKGQELTIRNHLGGEDINMAIGLSAPHHGTTAMIALAVLDALNLDWPKAASAFASLNEVEGRGNQISLRLGGRNVLLINDSYNAGPASMAASLAHVAALPHAKKALILTDMLELGAKSDEAHEALITSIAALAPYQLILIGEAMGKIQHLITGAHAITHYPTAALAEASLSGDLSDSLSGCDLILVKGSNGSGAPQIAKHLLSFSVPSSFALQGGA